MNNIVLVNSLIDANIDSVIMMLDWAKRDTTQLTMGIWRMCCFAWDVMELDWKKADEHTNGLHIACDWEHIERGNHLRALRMSTTASNAVVCVGEKSEKGGQERKGEKMKKEERERQTRTRRGVGIPTCSNQCFHLG